MSKFDQTVGPGDAALDRVSDELASQSAGLDASGSWPAEQLKMLGEAGVYRWFQPREWAGVDWSEADLARGYVRLAAACLTTTFVLTQRSAAVRRIVECDNESAKERLLPDLASGDQFATVGI